MRCYGSLASGPPRSRTRCSRNTSSMRAVEVDDQPQLVVGVTGRPSPARPGACGGEDRGHVLHGPVQVDLDHHPAAVVRVALPADEARLLQPVDHPGDRRSGEPGGPGQLTGRHVPAEAEDVQAVQVGRVDADLVCGRGAHELHQRPGPAEAGREGHLELRALLPPRPSGRRLGPRRLPARLGAPARRRLPARLCSARLCPRPGSPSCPAADPARSSDMLYLPII